MSRAITSLATRVPALAVEAPSPRVDLRSGLLAGGLVANPPQHLSEWTMAVTAARNAWIASGRSAPLSAPAPASLFQDGIASSVDALLRGADFPMRSLTIEVEETALLGAGPDGLAAVERLRARGWGVGLRCAEGCPMPLGRRSRSLFTEILADTPDDLSPALALAEPSARPLTARIRAAHQAGLVTVALNVKSPAQAGLLIALGFDRGAGPGYRV